MPFQGEEGDESQRQSGGVEGRGLQWNLCGIPAEIWAAAGKDHRREPGEGTSGAQSELFVIIIISIRFVKANVVSSGDQRKHCISQASLRHLALKACDKQRYTDTHRRRESDRIIVCSYRKRLKKFSTSGKNPAPSTRRPFKSWRRKPMRQHGLDLFRRVYRRLQGSSRQ